MDVVHLWDPEERRAHGVRLARADFVSTHAQFGQLSIPIRGVEMRAGSVLDVSLRSAVPYATAVAIRIATRPEHHGRPQAYTVEVDGHEVCSEVTVDPGAGATRTVFVRIDTRSPRLSLRIRTPWRGAVPIVVDSLRVYRQPTESALNAVPGGRWPMDVALLTSKGHGYALDAEEVRRLVGLFPESPWVSPQVAVLYNFCTKDYVSQQTAMRRFADLALQTRVPVRVAPQMHWAGIPAGVPDGAGGTFTDVPYQQITWDPDDQTHDEGLQPLLGERYDIRYGLSIPNRWGNTPWLTFNHPRLNQFRRIRLREALTAWLSARERLVRLGLGHLFPPQLATGEETVYWAKGVDDSAYTAHNRGKPRTALLADFNPFTVADALSDGVILDPSNGLDGRERWWLHQNLSRWQQTIVDWMLSAVPPEPIRVTAAGPVFAEDLIRRNIFTEPYGMPVFPMKGVNPRRPGLEVGYVKDGRSGGQYWSGATMLPWLVKQRDLGRIALPNLECTGADDPQVKACLLAAYASGARYAVLYNWHHRPTTRQLLNEYVRALQGDCSELRAAPASHGEARHDGTNVRTFVAGQDAFAVNVLMATAAELNAREVTVRITLRTLDEQPARSVSMTGLLTRTGEAPYRMQVQLPVPFPVRPGERYAMEATELTGPEGSPPAAVGLRPWRAVMNARLERWRSFAVADWQDATDIIGSLKRQVDSDAMNPHARQRLQLAEAHMRRGRPLEAYRAAIRAEQLMFPCTFIVQPPGGNLTPFPVQVECSDDRVRVVLQAVTAEALSATLLSSMSQRVTVRYAGRSTDVDLTADRPLTLGLETGR